MVAGGVYELRERDVSYKPRKQLFLEPIYSTSLLGPTPKNEEFVICDFPPANKPAKIERYGMHADPIFLGIVPTDEQEAIASDKKIGFRFGDKGTHSSRTIMLDELSILLRLSPLSLNREEYRKVIVQDNCLGKRTVSTRKLSHQRLSELYALDRDVLLFRVMRRLWQADERGRPLLALLLAMARDPLLRITAPPIIRIAAWGRT